MTNFSTTRLGIGLATLLLADPAVAQTAVKLEGRCEKLVIAGQDLSGSCKGTLMNTVSRSRTSFDFTTGDGRSLSFSGNGAQQERTEDTDPLQPINLVIPSEKTKDGVVQGPLVAVGSCTFTSPQPGKTAIACEANAAKGRYEATFVTETKSAAGTETKSDVSAPGK
jgi:hypothetical protein